MTATRIRSWRSLLAAHRDEGIEATGRVVERIVASDLPDADRAAVLAGALRIASPYVLAWLGAEKVATALRSVGYFETPHVRARAVRLTDVEFAAAPGGTWPMQPVRFVSPPDIGTVYRGATDHGLAAGLSWTSSLSLARQFAERRGGRVWTCNPQRPALLAGFAEWTGPGPVEPGAVQRVEPEYLLDPALIEPEEVRR